MTEPGQPNLADPSAALKEKTKADVVSLLTEKKNDMLAEWDQNFPEGAVVEGRPDDWETYVAQAEKAISTLEQDDPTTARILLDSYILEAQEKLTGRSLDQFGEWGHTRDNAKRLREKSLNELKALRSVLG